MAIDNATDVQPFAGFDSEVDTILYFTDDKNEPKKLNVRRAIEGDDLYSGNAMGYTDGGEDMKDFIMACPKTPLNEIKFDFAFDSSIAQSNFKASDGMVFSYQNIYRDNTVSAPAIFSAVAYPEEIQFLGSQDIETAQIPNVCLLYIPRPSSEIYKVRILFREGDNGAVKIIDEISVANPDSPSFELAADGSPFIGTYSFLNDRVFAVLPEAEASKDFDRVPKKAKSLAVADNRMMYANYEEGFDTFSIKTEATVIYKDKPADLFDFGIKAVPSMVINESGSNVANGKKAVTKNSGFYLDVTGLPDQVSPGEFSVKIIVNPQRNFHAYNGAHPLNNNEASIHGSEERDEGHVTGSGVFFNESGNFSGSDQDLGGPSNPFSGLTNSFGVGDGSVEGNLISGAWNDGSFAQNLRVGTSAFAPIIIKGDQLVFEVQFTLSSETTREEISNIITNALCGGGQTTEVTFGIGDDRIAEVRVDLGLNEGQEIFQNDSLADLVCCVHPTASSSDGFNNEPDGFFIINKAVARFACEKDTTNYDPNGGTDYVNRIKICMSELYVNDVKTCLPIPKTGFSPMVYSNGSRSPWTKEILPNGAQRLQWPNVKSQDQNSSFGGSNFVEDVADLIKTGGDGDQRSNGRYFPAPIGSWKVYDDPTTKTSTEWADEGWSCQLSQSLSNFIENFDEDLADIGYSYNTTSDLDALKENVSGSPNDVFGTLSENWEGKVQGTVVDYVELDGTAGGFTYLESFYDNFTASGITNSNEQNNRFSLVDGQCGPGGMQDQLEARAIKVKDVTAVFSDASPEVDNISLQACRLSNMVGGNAFAMNTSGSVFSETLLGRVVNMPFMEGDSFNDHSLGLGTVTNNSLNEKRAKVVEVEDSFAAALDQQIVNLKYRPTPSEDPSSDAYIPNSTGAGTFNILPAISNFQGINSGGNIGSFKTNALHNFGVVYYDDRGRRSGVVPIDPVFVGGYSNEDRPSQSQKGSVSVQIKIVSQAPPWATDYRIVYGGNSTIERFTQYSVDGAFAKKNADSDDNKFFLSLNYLQKTDISYATAGGAKNQEDLTGDLYRFTPGDKLRVISYYDANNSGIIYASREEVFDVVEVVTLDEDMQNHPFADTSIDEGSVDTYVYDGDNISTVTRKQNQINPSVSNNRNRLNGQFLVVKNNINSDLFGLSDFSINSGLSVKTNPNWERRCIVEIFTPKKGGDEDLTTYYEIGYDGANDGYSNTYGGSCITSGDENVHFPNVITIEKGDVFYRQVPVNLQKFTGGNFASLISSSAGEDTSGSNFLPVSLETSSVVDYHVSSSKGFGKPCFVIPNEKKTRNETSITFSDRTLTNVFDNNFSSFPLSMNFKDLPIENGAIDYITPRGNKLTVLQRKKVSDILLGRDVLSTASGQESVSVSNKVLGAASFYPIDYGSSGSPSSVFVEDDVVYFADLDNQKIVKIDQKGLDIISERSMDKYFKNKISEFLLSPKQTRRAVIGYDPVNDEMIFSLMNFDSSVGPATFLTKTQLLNAESASLPSDTSDINVSLASVAYSPGGGGRWSTRYDFSSTCYANIRNEFLSFRCTKEQDSTNPMVWVHNDKDSRNSFYGAPCVSMFKSVANGYETDSPSLIKEFNAISLESNKNWDVNISTSNDKTTVREFTDYEGVKYASIPRSVKSLSGNSSEYFLLGTASLGAILDSVTGVSSTPAEITILLDNDVKHFVPMGDDVEVVYIKNLADGEKITPLFPDMNSGVSSIIGNTLTLNRIFGLEFPQSFNSAFVDEGTTFDDFAANTDLDERLEILIKGASLVYGDQLRDSYATVTCVTDNQEKTELYAVNLEYTQSKLDPTA